MKRLGAAIVLLLATATTARAAPPTKLECAAAHEDAQRLRRNGELRGAREKLLVCSRDPCPKVVEDECVPWLAEVERAMPSLVLEARTPSGADVPDVRVALDGRPLLERLDGRPVELDPGEHLLRFEPARGAPIERHVLVAEGEKGRIVRVDVDPPAAVTSDVRVPTRETHDAARPATPWPAIIVGGAGVVALGGFTFFALTGLSAEHRLSDCAPRCPASRTDPVHRDYIAADVFLGVGIVSLAAATYLLLTAR